MFWYVLSYLNFNQRILPSNLSSILHCEDYRYLNLMLYCSFNKFQLQNHSILEWVDDQWRFVPIWNGGLQMFLFCNIVQSSFTSFVRIYEVSVYPVGLPLFVKFCFILTYFCVCYPVVVLRYGVT